MTDVTDAPATDLIPAGKPLTEILTNTDELEKVLGQIEERVRSEAMAIDPSEKKGRDALKSLAYKVARSKTALDDAGKNLGEDLRKQLAAINGQRQVVKDRLDPLQAETKKPADEWEQREKERRAKHQRDLDALRAVAVPPAGADSDTIRTALETVDGIDPAKFEEFAELADQIKREARGRLATALEAEIKREQELEELRAQKAEIKKLRAEKEARERAESEAEAKRRAEEEEKARAEREERIRQEAAEKAAAQAREEERARIEAEERKKREAAEKARAEDERKAANKRHRAKVRKEAVAAIQELFDHPEHFGEKSGAEIVFDAIAADTIPHITVNY